MHTRLFRYLHSKMVMAVILLCLVVVAMATTLTACTTDAPTTGTATAAVVTSTGLCPVYVDCDTEGNCTVVSDFDEHGHYLVSDYVNLGGPADDIDNWEQFSYRPANPGCSLSKFAKLCSRKDGTCPKGNQRWCQTESCLIDNGNGTFTTDKHQANCRDCSAGVNPNTSTNGCSPI